MIKQQTFVREHTTPIKWIVRKNAIPLELCNLAIDYAMGTESGFHRVNNRTPKHWDIRCDTCRVSLTSEVNTELSKVILPIWEQAISFYGMETTHIEEYEIKRYNIGDYVTEHVDQFYGTMGNTERKLTMLIQLNEGYEGGDLMVAKNSMPKTAGTVIVIPSFYIHEVLPITKGERWSLNCWAWGPLWK